MSNERIDLTQFEGLDIDREMMHFQGIIEEIPNLLAELKRCYEREDVANEALLENAEMMRKYVGQIIEMKRNIREMIDACEGVDSLFGEEVVGMLQELLASE